MQGNKSGPTKYCCLFIPRQKGKRLATGSVLALSISLTCFVIVLASGLFHICLLICGNFQFKDAVKAGVLSVIKEAMLKPSLRLTKRDDPYGILSAVQEPYDGVNLKNFNKIAAVELLVELNEASMEAEGSSTRQSLQNAAELNNTVAGLAVKFTQNLRGLAQRIMAFEQIALQNQVTMFSARTVPAAGSWGSAYLHENTASNIYLGQRQLPPGVKAEIPYSNIRIKGQFRSYISGYAQVDSGVDSRVRRPRQSYFFPLRPPLKPHLIAERDFRRNRSEPRRIDQRYAVPNSFEGRGKIRVPLADQSISYAAYAVAEAMDEGYPACIPSGFIRIENQTGDPIDLADLFDSPLAFSMKKNLLQRLWEINPDFDPSSLNRILPRRLYGRGKAIISDSRFEQNPQARFLAADGAKVLRPVKVPAEGKVLQLQWIPSTGYNGLLAVIEITEAIN